MKLFHTNTTTIPLFLVAASALLGTVGGEAAAAAASAAAAQDGPIGDTKNNEHQEEKTNHLRGVAVAPIERRVQDVTGEDYFAAAEGQQYMYEDNSSDGAKQDLDAPDKDSSSHNVNKNNNNHNENPGIVYNVYTATTADTATPTAPQSFSSSNDVTILFSSFRTSTGAEYLFALIFTAILAFTLETLVACRRDDWLGLLNNSNASSSSSSPRPSRPSRLSRPKASSSRSTSSSSSSSSASATSTDPSSSASHEDPSSPTPSRASPSILVTSLLLSLLHVLTMCVGLLLILAVCSFNAGIFVAAVVGCGLAHFAYLYQLLLKRDDAERKNNLEEGGGGGDARSCGASSTAGDSSSSSSGGGGDDDHHSADLHGVEASSSPHAHFVERHGATQGAQGVQVVCGEKRSLAAALALTSIPEDGGDSSGSGVGSGAGPCSDLLLASGSGSYERHLLQQRRRRAYYAAAGPPPSSRRRRQQRAGGGGAGRYYRPSSSSSSSAAQRSSSAAATRSRCPHSRVPSTISVSPNEEDGELLRRRLARSEAMKRQRLHLIEAGLLPQPSSSSSSSSTSSSSSPARTGSTESEAPSSPAASSANKPAEPSPSQGTLPSNSSSPQADKSKNGGEKEEVGKVGIFGKVDDIFEDNPSTNPFASDSNTDTEDDNDDNNDDGLGNELSNLALAQEAIKNEIEMLNSEHYMNEL